MTMAFVTVCLFVVSLIFGAAHGTLSKISAATLSGAQSALELCFSMAGALCLWNGVMTVLERSSLGLHLGHALRFVLRRLFPQAGRDEETLTALSGNLSANLLGLGNAATPMGIRAARRMAEKSEKGMATDEMCRLIVLNTASIQLIPTTVAAIRAGLGCPSPFDILPAIWITSLCSAGVGLLACCILGKLWKHG